LTGKAKIVRAGLKEIDVSQFTGRDS
jgi:hypothetical protein